MALPFFYKEDLTTADTSIVLDEATSKHVVQVLRMQNGEQVRLTNGKGDLFTAEITDNNRKRCVVSVIQKSEIVPQGPQGNPKSKISIAISPVKNNTRFEWFLEKATEIGVSEIIPLLCERTEKTVFKYDRMKNILVSAMLQSQQTLLPILHEPVKFKQLVETSTHQQKFIAYCEEDKKIQLADAINESLLSKIMLIGPEGDFTPAEIEHALKHHFLPVSLGDNRLRTETAGIAAATLLRLI